MTKFAIVVLIGLLVWSFVRTELTCMRIGFADEQIAIFHEMVEKADAELANSPPDVDEAIGALQYTHRYYPSGSKQIAGSRLDRIVERSRQTCELRIIEMLREATGDDLGNDPEAWIRHFDTKPVPPAANKDAGAPTSQKRGNADRQPTS